MSEGTGKVKKVKKPKSALREYVEAITIALTLALGLRFFVIEAFKIPSGSMIETLAIGDFIFVNKLSYRTEIPYSLLGVKIPGGGTTLVEWSGPDRGGGVARWVGRGVRMVEMGEDHLRALGLGERRGPPAPPAPAPWGRS